ncbi:MAG: recombination protein RecR [Desulfovibrionaceae bacterium]|nr:recombination protein RecR [Desulfovibrionaceae bacterium]
MNENIPEALRTIVEQLQKFPGLGPKSALRCALFLLDLPERDVKTLGTNIASLRDILFKCTHCGTLSDTEICSLCSDTGRDDTLLCIVREWDSFLHIENAGFYKGRYLVLTPSESTSGVHLDSSDIQRLRTALERRKVEEVILGLGTTLEAENTITSLSHLIKKEYPHIAITRLAQGIPLGAEVKFMDKETLRQSMRYRHSLE